uniref:Uncharacterized protein n=1 Tax=Ditylenchus dipsaci TaxID=166011 RepID=A0A915EV67_9BILA
MALLVQNETNGYEWHTIFYIIAGSLVFSNAVFCVYATDQPCEFTKITKQSRMAENEKKMELLWTKPFETVYSSLIDCNSF